VAQKNPINRPYYNNESQVQGYASTQTSQDILLQKLNYMINLLEEQQDEKTNNVTEEVILYSFLGIFIIFVIDSFARVGKYVR
jgi:high-affinity K+ transport system ATPase subunit B